MQLRANSQLSSYADLYSKGNLQLKVGELENA